MTIRDFEEERLVRIGYRLHMRRHIQCRCDRDECPNCTNQFLFDVLKRVVIIHNTPRMVGHNGGPILERLS